MAFEYNAITTGLMGYSLKKEMLSEGLLYRELETFNYTVYVRPLQTATNIYDDIHNKIRTQYSNVYSGDLNVKVFEVPGDYFFPNDSVRLAKFTAQVEVRKTITSLDTITPEITGNYYKGVDHTFISTNCRNLNDLKDEFSFENGENGNKTYVHNLSFSVRTGGKTEAGRIASGIFTQDVNTTLGVYAFASGVSNVAGTNCLNYYTESYDLLKNAYAFSKKREILSALNSSYTYNLNHSVSMKDDGTMDIIEKGDVFGKITFDQAYAGMGDLLSTSYARCNTLYTQYKDFVGGTGVDDALINLIVSANKILNRPR